jgi:hypothetical protein
MINNFYKGKAPDIMVKGLYFGLPIAVMYKANSLSPSTPTNRSTSPSKKDPIWQEPRLFATAARAAFWAICPASR